VEPQVIRNRLVLVTTTWREMTGEPLPRLTPGKPEEQLQEFEIKLVDTLWAKATPLDAREIADRTWELVYDRPDSDPVKKRVVECHEALARLSAHGL
jgi:hypothetical protein